MSSSSIEAVADEVTADETALLKALVVRPTENPPGDTNAAMEWLGLWLQDRGHTVEWHPCPAPFGRHYGRGEVINLVVRHTFGAGPTVALHAPLDTIPAGSHWRHDPFGAEIKDGLLFGRGARDSKADIVAYIFAFEALIADPAGLSGTLELHITADEESGGFLGPAFLLSHHLSAPDAVIAAGTAYQVIVGQEGVLHMEVILRGRQAHASRPEDGHDAMIAAVAILSALTDGGAEREPLTIGLIEGGRGVNLVADRVRFTIDRRLKADDDGEAVEAALIERISAVPVNANVEVECRRLLLAEPVEPTERSARLADTLSRHAEAALAQPVPVVSAPVVSGARHYALAGIPTALYGVGPPIVGEAVDFSADESVRLGDLSRSTKAIIGAVRELLTAP
ncbi:M20/M25/M40 family metallo-hydrolase [Acuticoccus sp. M5D2P5]|uniref:M20/M25/M40 family metallo-hydrolase n=1 Tax=Acuticoccus kalidii TaxID=2910977 RepID=UPI001F3EFA11|nr:M20/M25/M40 family metallo-hydrolase [Acuticoccus kalidii]MCF3932577.1 M20/M25/M40 family metallo-hydrolase [Acuticoccus kalidii]